MNRKSTQIGGLIDTVLEVIQRLGTKSRRKLIQSIATDISAVQGKKEFLGDIVTVNLDHAYGRMEEVIFLIAGAAKLRAVIEEHRAKDIWTEPASDGPYAWPQSLALSCHHNALPAAAST